MSTAAVAVVRVDDAYLPLKALSRDVGLSVRTIRKYLHDPMWPLPHYRIGGKILVRRSEFDAWAARFRVVNASALDSVVAEVVAGLRR